MCELPPELTDPEVTLVVDELFQKSDAVVHELFNKILQEEIQWKS